MAHETGSNPRRSAPDKKKQKHNERTQSHREIEDPRRGL